MDSKEAVYSRRNFMKLAGGTLLGTMVLGTMSLEQLAEAAEFKGKKILIVYYTRTGNTERVAKSIQKQIGGDLFRVQTTHQYPTDYRATTEQAKQELRQKFRPKLMSNVNNIAAYDIVFVGYPIWWGTMPMGIYSFLEQNNLTGKTIRPFCTHQGSGLGSSVRDIKKSCPQSVVTDGLAIYGSESVHAADDVSDWLKKV